MVKCIEKEEKQGRHKCIQGNTVDEGEDPEEDDFEGEDTAEIQGIISGIVAGDVEHKKKITLSEAEIAEVAKYMTTGS